jgi:hypothetical protein
LGSTREVELNLEKTVKWSNFTTPSPIKTTPSESASDSDIVSDQQITSNQDIARPATLSDPAILRESTRLSNPATFSKPVIICDSAIISNPVTLSNPAISHDSTTLSDPAMPSNPATFSDLSMLSNADDVMLTSPSQSKELHVNHSTPTASNPSEGSTMAVVAVMRGNPKDGYTHQRSNKHCKQKIVWVLLDSHSNGDLIFVNKDNPCCFPTQNGWFHSHGILQMGSSRCGVKPGWS